MNLDYQARGALWNQGLDFNHGTGHGVGFLSSVHERPNGIRWKIVPERMDSCILDEGMFQSDEPGLYIEGSHGIRTENLLICHRAEKNMYGQFMNFENLTFAPIDLDAVDLSVMEPSDVRQLNAYHKEVYEKLKDRKDIKLTSTMAVENSGFTADLETIYGESPKGRFFLCRFLKISFLS